MIENMPFWGETHPGDLFLPWVLWRLPLNRIAVQTPIHGVWEMSPDQPLPVLQLVLWTRVVPLESQVSLNCWFGLVVWISI